MTTSAGNALGRLAVIAIALCSGALIPLRGSTDAKSPIASASTSSNCIDEALAATGQVFRVIVSNPTDAMAIASVEETVAAEMIAGYGDDSPQYNAYSNGEATGSHDAYFGTVASAQAAAKPSITIACGGAQSGTTTFSNLQPKKLRNAFRTLCDGNNPRVDSAVAQSHMSGFRVAFTCDKSSKGLIVFDTHADLSSNLLQMAQWGYLSGCDILGPNWLVQIYGKTIAESLSVAKVFQDAAGGKIESR